MGGKKHSLEKSRFLLCVTDTAWRWRWCWWCKFTFQVHCLCCYTTIVALPWWVVHDVLWELSGVLLGQSLAYNGMFWLAAPSPSVASLLLTVHWSEAGILSTTLVLCCCYHKAKDVLRVFMNVSFPFGSCALLMALLRHVWRLASPLQHCKGGVEDYLCMSHHCLYMDFL